MPDGTGVGGKSAFHAATALGVGVGVGVGFGVGVGEGVAAGGEVG